MATFKAIVQDKRKDGTYQVKIRITHNREVRRLATNIFVESGGVTRGLKIKDQQVIDQAEDLIRKCRKICNDVGFGISAMSVDDLVNRIKLKLQDGEGWRLDFIDYTRKIASTMNPGTGGLYLTAIRALVRFIDRETLDISEINTNFLNKFEAFLMSEPSQRGKKHNQGKGGRAVSLYMERLRAVYNRAKEEFNDEDAGVIRIPWSPFKKYKVKSEPRTQKRAISVETMQAIIDLPISEQDNNTGNFKREELARDCFLLSFGLIGMNSADLFDCLPAKGKELIYYRRKTASRRIDKAEMHVLIPDVLDNLIEKYRDKSGQRQFCFYRHYANHQNFNRALNKGLALIAERVGMDSLTFYAARHTWATIARSAAVGIEKATVHEALNHVDRDMRVTDIYIDRDWSVIWRANERVLNLFEWDAIVKNDC